MKTVGQGEARPLSMLFELAREENPRLYDDLARFNKGTKRINRLRFLAHEGLLMQHGLIAVQMLASAAGSAEGGGRDDGALRGRPGDSKVVEALFAAPLSE